MNREKQHAIEIKGKVQMIGFRNFVEANALGLGLGGIVFNDKDGSVKILCEGNEDKIKTLIRLIEVGSADLGARIESLKDEEIPIKIPLPPTFFKEPTVELKDIKERLDEGIEILKSMDSKLGNMDEKLGNMDGKLGSMDEKLGTLEIMDKKLDKLDGIGTTLVDIKSVLKKIAEKK
ncbi:MAG: acylphosphatase [Candidatus Hydrothermarchaeota archaeon]|nr:acylphosphatase [Candidatus Hydrothermarchaeota archaeon]